MLIFLDKQVTIDGRCSCECEQDIKAGNACSSDFPPQPGGRLSLLTAADWISSAGQPFQAQQQTAFLLHSNSILLQHHRTVHYVERGDYKHGSRSDRKDVITYIRDVTLI